jgi:hypothetical protein
MKINKKMVLICFTGMVISIIIYVTLIVYYCPASHFKSIFINLFTGFMISSIISLTNYFHEKQKIIKSAFDFIKSELQFIDFYHLKIGKLLEMCTCHFDYEKNLAYYRYFSNRCEGAESFLSLITETSEKLNTIDYCGFLNNSKLVLTLKEIYLFKQEINGLRQLSSEILKLPLEIKIFLQDIELKIMRQQLVDHAHVNRDMEAYNKSLLVKLSKLHEYTASLTITAEKLLRTLCKNVNCGVKPNEITILIDNYKETNKRII